MTRFRPFVQRQWDGTRRWVLDMYQKSNGVVMALFSDEPPPDQDRGLYGKYRVEKINGKPIGQCFVLEERDPHALAALRAYAQSCRPAYPFLADDLEAMAKRWDDSRCHNSEHRSKPPCQRRGEPSWWCQVCWKRLPNDFAA